MGLKDFLFGKKVAKEIICSVANGDVIKLEDVPDPVFAQKMVGDGIAVLPNDNNIYSPVDGVVDNILDSKHAFTIVTKHGAQVLVHIGLDTVKLKGQYFSMDIKSGDEVKQGQKIGEVDFESVKSEGYNLHTMILIANTDEYSKIIYTDKNNVKYNDMILELNK